MIVQKLQCHMQSCTFNNLKFYFKQKTEIQLISCLPQKNIHENRFQALNTAFPVIHETLSQVVKILQRQVSTLEILKFWRHYFSDEAQNT